MSFCDFDDEEDVEDTGQGCAFDDEEESKKDALELIYLSDIPLFRSVKAVQRPDLMPGGKALSWSGRKEEDDSDTELQYTSHTSRVAYRDESGGSAGDSDDEWADEGSAEGSVGSSAGGSAGIRILEYIPEWFAFTSSSYIDDPDDMLNILKEMLKSRDTTTPTFKISSTHYQITGSVIHDEKTMEFQINIFRSSKYGGSLVEFQRQSGSVRDFLAFHRQCIAHITAE